MEAIFIPEVSDSDDAGVSDRDTLVRVSNLSPPSSGLIPHTMFIARARRCRWLPEEPHHYQRRPRSHPKRKSYQATVTRSC